MSTTVKGLFAAGECAAGLHGGALATACVVYFWARVVHYFAYTFKIPWVRTLAFAVGFLCQMTFAWKLLF